MSKNLNNIYQYNFTGTRLVLYCFLVVRYGWVYTYTWWRHQMEIFSASLAICAGNSPVTGEFPSQRPMTRSFDVFFDRRLNKRLCEQSWGWWFVTPWHPLWHHCNASGLLCWQMGKIDHLCISQAALKDMCDWVLCKHYKLEWVIQP